MAATVTVDNATGHLVIQIRVPVPGEINERGEPQSKNERLGKAFQTASIEFADAWKIATIDTVALDAELATKAAEVAALKARKVDVKLDDKEAINGAAIQ